MFLHIAHNYPYQICIKEPGYNAFCHFFLVVYGHMTKKAITPIQDKIPLNSSMRYKRPMVFGHGVQHWECGLYKVLTNDNSGLT